jgi:hypothetical protein
MKTDRSILAVVLSAGLAAAIVPAEAGENYSFPSVNGVALAVTPTPHFVPPADAQAEAKIAPYTGSLSVVGVSKSGDYAPLPKYEGRFGMKTTSGDAYAYRFLTHALASAAYRNYEQDYYRLFGPGYAVATWTDRVLSGYIEVGYGGAVDAWTAGAYYLSKLRGPRRRHESAPDLSTMPEFRSHPELDAAPVFEAK